jgi:ABC-type branched-subunit amino acid transport system substrate-binding protein
MKVVEEVRYKRNTVDVDEGLAKLKAAQPDAVIFVGTYKPFAAVVKKAKAAGMKTKFLTVSFIGTADFIKEAGADGEGTYITQVLPSPDDASNELAKQFQRDVKGGAGSYTSFEGYANAAVLVEALKKAGTAPTRATFTNALESMTTDLGGLKVGFSPSRHQGSSQVFVTEVRAGKAVPITKFGG